MDEGDGVIKRKRVTDKAQHGIFCPMCYEGEGKCKGQACAWWVDDDEERGHCAALDWGRRDDAGR